MEREENILLSDIASGVPWCRCTLLLELTSVQRDPALARRSWRQPAIDEWRRTRTQKVAVQRQTGAEDRFLTLKYDTLCVKLLHIVSTTGCA
jgi:hypothetical protein